MVQEETVCELCFLYFLEELSEERKRVFERHLSGCQTCTQELAELRQMWQALPAEAELVEVPEALKGQVLGGVLGASAGGETLVDERSADKRRTVEWRLNDGTALRRKRWTKGLGYTAAALFFFVCGAGTAIVGNLSLPFKFSAGQPKTQPAIPVEVIGQYQLKAFDQSLPSAGGQGWLTRQGNKAQLVLQLRGLRPTDGAQAYQVWLLRDGKRSNCGTFQVDSQGSGVLTWDMALEDTSFDGIGITLEPDSRGSEPRGKKVLGT
ncbi:anti-sigma factor [Paenibacillus ehimensis]|uniref:anti-sigma factor n=1 Tax=Paenibacillus ehimensis TaxID=79264 RepID=UPI0013E37384|nr:anti-sigma factor [Paenibacillus ehimensis]